MGYKAGDNYYSEFTTQTVAGVATNADGLPSATANKNGTDDVAFSLTVANIDTGRYKITGVIPTSYVEKDVVNISIAATVSSIAGKAITDSFVIDLDIYHADIQFNKDTVSGNDEYNVVWFKNGVPVADSVTSNGQIQVIKRLDGTDQIGDTAMTQIGATAAWKYDEPTNKLTNGEVYLVVATITIASVVRTWKRWVGRDG